MNPDRINETRLRGLDYWKAPIEVEPLPGGITNRNYLVHTAGRRFVARLCEERPLLGIDRRNEVVCQRAAWACGIAPEVVHHEDGVLISAHQRGRTLTPADVRRPEVLPRLAKVLRRLHDSWDALSGMMLYFSPLQTVQMYAQTARELGARLPEDIETLLEDARALVRRISPFTPTLCHNDLLAANLIDEEESGRLWVVDWEYAGVGHPLFDLANASANATLAAEAEEAFLEAYRGRVDRVELVELRIMKTMSSLREALWAVIQTVASDIEFDYHQYAAENFSAYREARARLGVVRS